MTERNDNSSLPLLLAISAAVVLSAAIGWLFIDQEAPIQAGPDEIPPATTQTETPVEPSASVLTSDIDATFRKARLAADADMLANPAGQNALYFYGRILAIEPDNAIAEAELDAVISRLSAIINAHMTAAEFNDAHNLAIKIAEVRPTSRYVQDIEKQIDDLASEYVATALQHAQAGNEQAAANAITEAEALPAREPDYFTAVRTSIAEVAEVAATRRAAEEKIIADTNQAVALATANSVARVRDAIALGQLIAPPDANARSYLAEAELPAEQRTELTRELVTALTDAAKSNFEPGQLPNAETFLDAAGLRMLTCLPIRLDKMRSIFTDEFWRLNQTMRSPRQNWMPLLADFQRLSMRT